MRENFVNYLGKRLDELEEMINKVFPLYYLKGWFKSWKQKRKQGFDNVEIWDLQITIAKFVLPRLKLFKETTPS